MAKITILLGGVRSGKSDYAQKIASSYGDDVIYFVSGKPVDEEMSKRIEEHKYNRPKEWRTIEVDGGNLGKELSNNSFNGCYVLDCLTIHIANLMEKLSDKQIFEHIKKIINDAISVSGHLVVVSNEVGMGVVPPYPDGRRFRDLLGKSNQLFAESADEVYLMVAGLKTKLK